MRFVGRRRNPATLARQVAMLVTAGVTVAVLTVSFATYAITHRTLLHDVDAALVASARQVATNPVPALGLGPRAQQSQSTNQGDHGPGPAGLGGALQLVGPDGKVRQPTFAGGRSLTLPVDAAELTIARSGKGVSYRDVTVAGEHLRLVTVGAGNSGAVQQARSLEDIDSTLDSLRLLLLLTVGVGLVVAGTVGFIVSRRGLRPVRRISAAARQVAATEDLSALIPETGPSDIADIAQSVNSVLRALTLSRDRQRQLVDDTSHELRTPLTSLRTNIELLVTLEENPEVAARLEAGDRAALITDLDNQLAELDDLVAKLVELARYGSGPSAGADVDIEALVGRAIGRARMRGPRVTFVDALTPGLHLNGHGDSLERAIINLLDNAVKFGPATGRVTLSGGPGFLSVSDEGPGVSEAEREAVFGRFYRSAASRSQPGSGLGLAMVAETAREHGGSATVTSAPGGGASFRLTLPGLVALA